MLRQRDVVVSRDDLARDTVALRDRLFAEEKKGRLVVGDALRNLSGGDIVERALSAFRGYHAESVLEPRHDGVAIADPQLLFYYQNHLAAHGLAWDVIAPPGSIPLYSSIAAPFGRTAAGGAS